jgi:catechol 2,3-dioxygenase-like lactoylglutathione lyase family enzyme
VPSFAGVNHFALTVTDLDVSQRFYTEVLGFLPVLDVGYGRVCLHKATGFSIALIRHPEGSGKPFTEQTTGLDHIGLTAADRDELVAWEDRFRELGVSFTPIQDLPLGHHLNFRDPDGIALELQAPTEMYAAALADARTRDVSDAEVLAMAEQMLGGELVVRPD